MGSLFETYLRQRDRRNFQRAQEPNIACQIAALDQQVRLILDEGAVLRGELGRSVQLHHYLIGMLDSITSFYERETRKRLGLELYHETFVRYLRDRFLLPRYEAESLFISANAALSRESASASMRDGYKDGLLALRGAAKPRSLVNAFRAQPANDLETSEVVAFPAVALAGA